MTTEEKLQKLSAIAKQVEICKNCDLYKGTTHGVAGEGNPDAQIMFIGEGPGFNEDRLARPFVGQAGRLLDQALAENGIKRSEVFIANVVKHRPPGNRDPLPNETTACAFWLDQQIEIINPSVIVTLGRYSMNKFLPGEFISQTHGQARFVQIANQKRIVICMYHPAAALRNGQVMLQFKQDFKKIIEFLQQTRKPSDGGTNQPPEEDEQLSLLN